MKEILKKLEKEGYDYAVAIATDEEIKNKSACGQIAFENNN